MYPTIEVSIRSGVTNSKFYAEVKSTSQVTGNVTTETIHESSSYTETFAHACNEFSREFKARKRNQKVTFRNFVQEAIENESLVG